MQHCLHYYPTISISITCYNFHAVFTLIKWCLHNQPCILVTVPLGFLKIFVYEAEGSSTLLGHVDVSQLKPAWNSQTICPPSSVKPRVRFMSVVGTGGVSFAVDLSQTPSDVMLDIPQTVHVKSTKAIVFPFNPPKDISDRQLDITVTSPSNIPAYLKVSQIRQDVDENIEVVDYKKASLRLSFAKKGRITLSKVSVPPLTDSTSSWFIGIALKNSTGSLNPSESKSVTLKLSQSFDYSYAAPICILFFVSLLLGIAMSILAVYLFKEYLVDPESLKGGGRDQVSAPSGRGRQGPSLRSLGEGEAGTKSPLPRGGGGSDQVSAPSGSGRQGPSHRSLGEGEAGTKSPLPRGGGGSDQVSAPSGSGRQGPSHRSLGEGEAGTKSPLPWGGGGRDQVSTPSGSGRQAPSLRSLGEGEAGTKSPLPRGGGGSDQVSAPSESGSQGPSHRSLGEGEAGTKSPLPRGGGGRDQVSASNRDQGIQPSNGRDNSNNSVRCAFIVAMMKVTCRYWFSGGPKTYSYATGVAGFVLMVGASQFVIANWYIMIQEGDRDGCYYNDFCYRVSDYHDIPLNLMISNLTYIVHALILSVCVLYMETKLYLFCENLEKSMISSEQSAEPSNGQENGNNVDNCQSSSSGSQVEALPNHVFFCPNITPHLQQGAVPKHTLGDKEKKKLMARALKRKYSYSIGYAFAWALLFEGLFSLLYHLCPSRYTFQFDSAFMFVIAGLTVVLVYNGMELRECPVYQAEQQPGKQHQVEANPEEKQPVEGSVEQQPIQEFKAHPGKQHPVEAHPGKQHPVEAHPGKQHLVEAHPGKQHQVETNSEEKQPEERSVEQQPMKEFKAHSGKQHPVEAHPGKQHQVEGNSEEKQQVERTSVRNLLIEEFNARFGKQHPVEAHPGEQHQVEANSEEKQPAEKSVEQHRVEEVETHSGKQHPGEAHPGEQQPVEANSEKKQPVERSVEQHPLEELSIGALNFFLYFIVPLFIFNYLGTLYHSESGLVIGLQVVFFIALVVWWLAMGCWAYCKLKLRKGVLPCGKFEGDSCEMRWNTCYCFTGCAIVPLALFVLIFLLMDLSQAFLFTCIVESVWALSAKAKLLQKLWALLCHFWKWLCRCTCSCNFNSSTSVPQGLYIFVTVGLLAAAVGVFQGLQTTDKTALPEDSRDHNKECEILGFFDWHDLWHFLSSFALLMGAFVIMFISAEPKNNTAQRDGDGKSDKSESTGRENAGADLSVDGNDVETNAV